mgnify:FL=1
MAQYLDLPQRLILLNSSHPITGETAPRPDGITLFWWLSRYLDDRGRPQGIVGGWIDISEKASLTRELNKALEQAKRASFEKSNFVARISHEIRTPLNAVLGLLEIEREKSDSLAIAWQAAITLRDLIGEILDLSRIEAGELKLEITNNRLDEVLAANAKIFSNRALAKGLQWSSNLNVPSDSFFHFDRIRLNQIIANLLGNAIKYTENGSVIFNAVLKNEELEVSIIDTGIGIAKNAMFSIGQPWFQIDPSTAHSSGLGLAICYQLVELMGGVLDIESQPGLGTRVVVTLPIHVSLSNENINSDDELIPYVIPPQKVLIVDDFKANLTVMKLQLEEFGQQVTCCDSADLALKLLAQHRFDVLITDCQMPDINGYNLVNILLFQALAGKAYAPPIIFGCTANALMEEEDRARHAGMDYLLRKPLFLKQLGKSLSEQIALISIQPDVSELIRLSNGRTDILSLMCQQLRDAINDDVHKLKNRTYPLEEISQIGHRLRASFSLFNMRKAVRGCQVIENLPESISSGVIRYEDIDSVIESFIHLIKNSLDEIETALLKII